MSDVQTSEPINGQMGVRALMDTAAMDWQPAPGGKVWRKRLHLVGPAESGQVTSIVRYEPDSEFAPHGHPDGEEILVLEGTFCDEHEVSPAGTYLLHPEGFSHRPFSREGCLLFVKLRQYAGQGRRYVNLRTNALPWDRGPGAGIVVKALYDDRAFPDRTCLERWQPGASLAHRAYEGGAELLILDGALEDEHGRYAKGTWLRLPPRSTHAPRSPEGCECYLKVGGVAHQRSARRPWPRSIRRFW